MTALIKDALREIRKSFGRFLSIFLIIALGCGFFTGLKATEPDMIDTASEYFERTRLMDMRLRSSIGVKGADIAAVRTADGVKGACAGYTKDLLYKYNDQNIVVKAFSLNSNVTAGSENDLNTPELIEGRMPQAKNECVVENKMSTPDTFRIGNTITLLAPSDDEELGDTLACDTFEIVGIVISPLYIGFERDPTTVGSGSVNSNIFLTEETFVCDHYTDLYVSLELDEELDPFSKDYEQAVKEQGKAAASAFENSVTERYDKMKSDAQKKIDSAQNDITISEQALSCEAEELDEMLAEAQNGIKRLQAAYDSAENRTQGYLIRAQLLQTERKVEMLASLIADTDGSVRTQLAEQLEQAKAELSAANEQLAQTAELRILNETRFSSNDYSSYKDDADKINNVSKAFPMFFVLIAALVCVTAMTRMIEEQRTMIGSYKALGYSSRHILFKYLLYASAAAVGGSCIGSAIGLRVFPLLIINTYKILYNIPGAETPFRPTYMLLAMAAAVLLTSAAVIFTIAGELRDQPAEIMRPKPPTAGKRVLPERIPFIWNRMGFLMKVTVRNLLRYKKRFLMTLVGISGCTALIVTGFGLKYSVSSIVDKQFGEIFTYSGTAALNTSQDEPEKALGESEAIERYVPAVSMSVDAGTKNGTYAATLISPHGAIEDFVDMRGESGERLALGDDGVIITQKLAQMCSLKAGDELLIKDPDGIEYKAEISDVMRNYALNYVYISPKLYSDIFGKEGVCSIAMFDLTAAAEEDPDSFKSALIEDERVLGVSLIADSTRGFINSVKSMDAIVIMLIVCAAFLAVTVLFNLASINITERRRELATIKVLGFYDSETGAYIYRENVISAIIGIAIGMLLGRLLHYFVVVTVEVEAVLFNRELVWWAYLLGALLTFAFAAAVNFALYFKLKRINMVESLKSVE